jgi:hypothetical protein
VSEAGRQPSRPDVLTAASLIAAAGGSASTDLRHLVAALADAGSPAVSGALAAGGLDRAKLSELVAGRRSGTPHLVSPIPAVHRTLGVARGLALASGVDEEPAHVLLALLYDPSGLPASVWRLLDVDPARVRDHLAEAGIALPRAPLPTPRPPVAWRTVAFDAGDLPAVLRAMLDAYPPGSTLRWGWNRLGDDRCFVGFEDSGRTPDVAALVRAAVADPGRVDVTGDPASSGG